MRSEAVSHLTSNVEQVKAELRFCAALNVNRRGCRLHRPGGAARLICLDFAGRIIRGRAADLGNVAPFSTAACRPLARLALAGVADRHRHGTDRSSTYLLLRGGANAAWVCPSADCWEGLRLGCGLARDGSGVLGPNSTGRHLAPALSVANRPSRGGAAQRARVSTTTGRRRATPGDAAWVRRFGLRLLSVEAVVGCPIPATASTICRIVAEAGGDRASGRAPGADRRRTPACTWRWLAGNRERAGANCCLI